MEVCTTTPPTPEYVTPPATSDAPSPDPAPPRGGYRIHRRTQTGVILHLYNGSDSVYEVRLSYPNGSDGTDM